MNGSSEEIDEAMLQKLNKAELSNTAKSSLKQARSYAEQFNIQDFTGHKTSVSVDRYKRLRSDSAKLDGFTALSKYMRVDSAPSSSYAESDAVAVKIQDTCSCSSLKVSK